MGKHKIIDHRQPSAAAKLPRVLKGGEKVLANPIPEVPTDEVVQLRKETTKLRSQIDEYERKLRVADAQVAGLKQQLQNARDEATNLRRQQQQPEMEGSLPELVELISVDDIQRHGDTATIKGMVQADDVLGESELVIPVQQLKNIIKLKQKQRK